MKESPIKTERKTLHLPEDTVRALNKLAAKNGTDFSKEVRRAIDEYLDLETTAENIDMINGVIRQELSGQLKALGPAGTQRAAQSPGEPVGRTDKSPDDHICCGLLC